MCILHCTCQHNKLVHGYLQNELKAKIVYIRVTRAKYNIILTILFKIVLHLWKDQITKQN